VPARWALAFAIAAIVALVGAAQLRAISRRGKTRVRRRGAVVLAAAAALGWLFLPDLPGRIAVIAAATLALALFGVAFVDRAPPRGARLAAVSAASVAAVASGVRLEWSGVAALDVMGTVVILVVVANALRWLDATEGLAPAISVAILVGVFALGAFGEQDALATLAVATGGACVGFLAYNLPPASVYLNEDGALFLGFLAAALAIDVQPAIGAPGSLAVPMLLLALPLLEISLVPLGQLRRRKRIGPGRRDHLVHRLTLLSLGRGVALAVLIAAQLVLAGVAVFVGRGVVAPLWGLVAGATIVAGLAIAAVMKDVYGEPVPGFSARVKLLVLCLLTLAVLAAVPAGIVAVRARNSVDNARTLVRRAIHSARAGDAKTARVQFAAAAKAFEDASGSLDSPLLLPSLALPILGSNVQAARDLASIGLDLSRTGEQTSAAVDPDRLQVVDGTVPLDEVRRVTPDLERGARELDRAVRQLDEIDDTYLVSPVSKPLGKVDRELTSASREANNAVAAARVAPAIFGGDGPRRYFLAVQNNAEARATGGFIGSWGILNGDGGKVTLDNFERISVLNPLPGSNRVLNAPADYLDRYQRFSPAQTWQNINMSPNFPAVAQVMADQYQQATGEQVDGTLSVDSDGLAALLKLTGPVNVPGWPEPLTAQNVTRVTLSDAYSHFGSETERENFLRDVAHDVVDRATHTRLGNPTKIARVLGRAARQGHLILAFTNPKEETLARKLNVAGSVPAIHSDSLLVTTQNAGANKIDYYLRRNLTYAIHLDPGAGDRVARLTGRVDVKLDNTAPATGLPVYVIGPHDSRFAAGENRTFLSVYTPMGLTAATFDGTPLPLESMIELQRNVYAGFFSVPSQSSRTLAVDLSGTVHLDRHGWYTLDLVRQPAITPDDVTVKIDVPAGWRVADTRGLHVTGSRQGSVHLKLEDTTRLSVRLAPATDNIWRRLVDGQ